MIRQVQRGFIDPADLAHYGYDGKTVVFENFTKHCRFFVQSAAKCHAKLFVAHFSRKLNDFLHPRFHRKFIRRLRRAIDIAFCFLYRSVVGKQMDVGFVIFRCCLLNRIRIEFCRAECRGGPFRTPANPQFYHTLIAFSFPDFFGFCRRFFQPALLLLKINNHQYSRTIFHYPFQ